MAESLVASVSRFAKALFKREVALRPSDQVPEEVGSHLVTEGLAAPRERHCSELSTSSDGSFASCLEESEQRADGDGTESECGQSGASVCIRYPFQGQRYQHPRPSEDFFKMTQEFIGLFMTSHFERHCVAGVEICVTCQQALTILQKLHAAISGLQNRRRAILDNHTFMKVLLNLCNLDASVGSRICTVVDSDVRRFYRNGLPKPLWGSVEILQDEEAAIEQWKLFLGQAVEKIDPRTYVSKLGRPPRGASFPGGAEAGNASEQSDKMLLNEAKPSQEPVQVRESSQFKVVGCLDAQHLWVYSSVEMMESVLSLDKCVLEFLQDLADEGPRDQAPVVGSIVGIMSSNEHARRVLVLQVKGDVADVWAMDHGDIYQVPWSTLVDLSPHFERTPPKVGLCILKDVRAVPYLELLKECLRTRNTIIQAKEVVYHVCVVQRMSQHGGFQALFSLLSCPDQECRLNAIICMLHSCFGRYGRATLKEQGCVPVVLGCLKKLLMKHAPLDHENTNWEKLLAVKLLQILFQYDKQLLNEYAASDLLQVLVRTRESSSNIELRRVVNACIRTVLEPAYRECRPSSQVTQVSTSAEELRNATLTSCQQGSHNGLRGDPRPQILPSNLSATADTLGWQATESNGRFYLRNGLVDFRSDATHELRPEANIRLASARPLANIFCSFLNTWRPCVIYYGVTRHGTVSGISINHADRDLFRRGIDFMVGNLRPHLTSSSYSVEFVPLVRSPDEPPERAPWSVIEVRVCGVPQTVYTMSDGECFLREGNITYRATTYRLRQWVIKKEEERYLAREHSRGDGDDEEEEPAAEE